MSSSFLSGQTNPIKHDTQGSFWPFSLFSTPDVSVHEHEKTDEMKQEEERQAKKKFQQSIDKMLQMNRIPIIVKTSNEFKLKKNRCAIQKPTASGVASQTIGSFLYILNKKLMEENPGVLNEQTTLFLFIVDMNGKHTLPRIDETITSLYTRHKHDDGAMYINVSLEKVFG